MKKNAMMLLLLAVFVVPCMAQMTIDYSYDKQHRLTEVSYSASEKVFYSYDAANNLDLEVAVDDPSHLRSFMLWLSKTGGAVRDFFRCVVLRRPKGSRPPTA